MKKRRSIGVMLFGILLILIPAYTLKSNFYGLFATIFKLEGFFTMPQPIALLTSIISIALGIIALTCGFWVLFLKSWARKLAIYTAIFTIVYELSYGIYGSYLFGIAASKSQHNVTELPPTCFSVGMFIFGIMPTILFFSIIIYFFTRPKVKDQFMQGEGK